VSKKKPYHPDFDPRAEPLVKACAKGNLKRVRLLVEQGLPVNAVGSADDGYYPLHAAAEAGHDKVIAYLLTVGAKVECRTGAYIEQREETPLLLAARRGQLKSIQALVKGGADINAKTLLNNTALGWAVQMNDYKLFRFLLSNNAKTEPTLLRLAASRGDIKIIKELLTRGLKVQVGGDPKYGSLLYCAIGRDRIDMVRFLIERGADINQASGPFAATPLIQACSTRKWKIANYLLEKGADPSLGSKHEAYPLNYAVWRGGHETAKRLIKAGAKLDTVDFEGRTPLGWAVESRDRAMLQLLIKHGAQVPKKLIPTITRRFGKDILK
jgi:ankyrin repeat protein